jgi:hypothetical protein
MAIQQFAVNAARRRPYQVDQMNSRRALLPTIIANQNRQADIQRQEKMNQAQIGQWDAENALARKAYKQNIRQNEIGAGISALQGGFGMANMGSKATVGSAANKVVSGFGGGPIKGFMGSDIRLADVGSGLMTGYGLSKIIGGKKKKTLAKAAGGAAGGALMSAIGGGNPITGAISGLIGGSVLGKLF